MIWLLVLIGKHFKITDIYEDVIDINVFKELKGGIYLDKELNIMKGLIVILTLFAILITLFIINICLIRKCRKKGIVSTIGFISGTIFVISGIYILLTIPVAYTTIFYGDNEGTMMFVYTPFFILFELYLIAKQQDNISRNS